ncbi:GerMN domain-containing protein [Holdemania filiformis]|uniref:GerMN domain-containing protein n=1 Tax=Holdemania filiformis TaxID=61171 RepID=UPI002677383C|nr:GerMN domain-containing protein [Holdemania filiformis]
MKIKPETLKQGAALMFGAVALAAYLTTVLWPSRSQPVQTVSGSGGGGDMVQVYLLDEDATLIPYTLGIEEGLDLNQRVAEVLRLMTIGNEPVQGVRGLLPNNAQLENCTLQGSQLSLYFPENFRNYDPKTEMRLLEGLTWAVTQFDEVNEVLLYLAGEPLTHMPQLSTPVPLPLNRQIGINNFENTVNRLHDSHSLTVFYMRQKNGSSVYVPKTLRISNQTSLQDKLSSILSDISVFSQLKQPLAETQLTVLDCALDEGLLTINVSGEILDEEKKVNEELVTSLLLSIQSSLGVSQVQLQVDGVTVNLSGVNDDPIDLNSLILNQILL